MAGAWTPAQVALLKALPLVRRDGAGVPQLPMFLSKEKDVALISLGGCVR